MHRSSNSHLHQMHRTLYKCHLSRKQQLVWFAFATISYANMSSIVNASLYVWARSTCGRGKVKPCGTIKRCSSITFIPLQRHDMCNVKVGSHAQIRIQHSSNLALHPHNLRHGSTKQDGQAIMTEINEHNWKNSSLTEVLTLPTISVPSRHVHKLLSDSDSPIKKYLATKMGELADIHPRVKVVVDFKAQDQTDKKTESRKRILLMRNPAADASSSNNSNILDQTVNRINELCNMLPHLPQSNVQQLVTVYNALPSQPETIFIPYQKQSVSRILSKVLPASALPPPSSYEQIGHVAHLNLRSNHLPYGRLIGSVLIERVDSIKTVVNKLGEVGGPYRTYKVDLLAGDENYNVHLIEHGTSLYFDLTKVYWCTRLEGERTYMIQHDFEPNQVIADAFCGVGALLTRAALAKGCTILANDINPDAVTYCKDSAQRNGIDVSDPKLFHVQCGDARDFIMGLGTARSNLPHHLILNFPLASPSFLNALRWWPSGEKTSVPTRVHVYTFARGDEDRTPVETAIDMVADGLLPEGGYTEPTKFRGVYLNSLGCNVKAREIRDAAPAKLVICVSFSVTRALLRRMQGDYGLV